MLREWGVVDVQVDFTGLAIYARIAPHKTEHRQSLSDVGAEHPCDRDEFAQQLLKIDDLLRPGWAKG